MLAVFLIALLPRLLVFGVASVGPGTTLWDPDSLEYDQLGRGMALHGVFSQSPTPPFVPDRQRVPLFPAQIAVFYAIIGDHVDAARSWAVASNVVVSAMTAAMVAGLGSAWAGRRVGMAAGLLLATDLTSIAYSAMLLSETLFTLLLVVGTLAMARYARQPRVRNAALVGVLLGLATLTRPIGVFLPLALMPSFLVAHPLRRWPVGLRDAGLCLVVMALVVGPWTLRGRTGGGADAVTTQAAINAYFHRGALIEGAISGRDPEEVRTDLEAQFAREAAANGWTEEERVRVMQDRAMNLIRAHPWLYLRLQAQGMLKVLAPDTDAIFDTLGLRATADDKPVRWVYWLWAGLGMVQLALMYALASVGVVALARERRWFVATVLLAPAAYLLISAGPEAYARFRPPLMPAIAIMAAFGLIQWRSGPPKMRRQ